MTQPRLKFPLTSGLSAGIYGSSSENAGQPQSFRSASTPAVAEIKCAQISSISFKVSETPLIDKTCI